MKSNIEMMQTSRVSSGMNVLFLFLLGGFVVSIPIYTELVKIPEKSPIPFSLGIVGSVLMWGGALLYSLRKRFNVFKNMGKMKAWLQFHILFCLVGPLLIVYHSEFEVRAPNSAVAYYAMIAMVLSGFIGRYIYKHFLITLSGQKATHREIKEESNRLEQVIRNRFKTGGDLLENHSSFFKIKTGKQSLGLFRSVRYMIQMDRVERKLVSELDRFFPGEDGGRIRAHHKENIALKKLMIKQISLEKRISLLNMTTKLFSFWHAFHVPLVFILMLTFIIHVAAALIF